MKTPFVFGKIATDRNFTDREHETANLIANFTSLSNTIIISPRRWGKSSLVNRAARLAMDRDKSLRVCVVDLFNVRSEQHFYALLVQKLLAATSSRWEEAVENARRFLMGLVPKISIGSDPASEVSIEFDWNARPLKADDVLDLAERIAVEKNLKIVVCIDEFQNITEFTDADFFQRMLRSHWQNHAHVGYCLYGSKRSMMMEVFTNSSKPFYKFGDLMFLGKIDTEHLTRFIDQRFTDTGKAITADAAALIVQLADNHPYYVQQLAQLSWFRTEATCDSAIVREAHRVLVDQLSLLFATQVDAISNQQLCYLKALLAGETAITNQQTMLKYGISSSTAASRSKVQLVKADVLDNVAGNLTFQDPIFAYWLKYEYFNLPQY